MVLPALLFGQCEVDAGGDVSICPGESVSIGGAPTIVDAGAGAQITWDNGLGSGANPTVSPNATTTYTVTLTDNDGCSTTDEVTVTVFDSPQANFSFTPSGACAGLPVDFTNTSTGSGLSYDWNFGNPQSDDNTSTETNPSHEFVALGNGNDSFTVTLTVTDSNGCTDSFSQTVDVLQSPDPTVLDADIFTPFTMCGTSGQVSFDLTINNGSSTEATNTNYSIDWGDGSPGFSGSDFTSLDHTYNGAGFYDLTVTVDGANGCSNSATYEVFSGSNPSIGLANPGSTINLCAPNELTFPLTNYENNSPGTEYVVNFSDGSPPQTFVHPPPASISHVFDISSCGFTTTSGIPNSFQVQITASNPCGFTAATIEPIQTSSAPTAALDVFPGPEGCAGSPFTFSNVSTNANFNNNGVCSNLMLADWSISPATGWTVTSGSLSDPDSFSAVFDPGTYTITMVGTNPCGDDTVELEICVTEPPVADFTADPIEGCAPLLVPTENFSSSLQNCDQETYLWEVFPNTGWSFASGNANSIDPEFNFTQQGTYTIQLSVTNLCGTDIVTQQVNVIEPPTVDLAPIADACEGTVITPSASYDNGGGTISSYDWSFPGGSPGSANTASPGSITYNSDGSFTVTIEATNECGTGSDSESFVVEVAPTVTLGAAQNSICNGTSTTLTAGGASTYTWDPAPGLSGASGNTATASPTTQTTYSVTGFSPVGCSNTAQVTVDVNPLPIVSPDGTFEICEGECIDLAITVSGGQPPYGPYNWSPAASLDDPSSASPQACPTTTTNYTVSVTDANGCVGQAIVPVTVNPLPVVNAGPDLTLCDQPVPEQLTGATPAAGTWSGTNVDASGIFTPNGTGTFTLTYTFTDANGCTNSDQIEVEVIAPTIADAGLDEVFCQSVQGVQLNPTTPGGTWSGTDVTPSGVFTPNTPGTYTLTYEIGGGSCLSSDQIEVEVYDLPVADAGLDASICEGDSIQLGATSNGGALPYASEAWTVSPFIDDEIIADSWVQPDATTTFTWNVTDANGCEASDDVEIEVLGAPVVEAGPDITVCNQPIPEQLTGFSPIAGPGETGEWSGPDIDASGVFTPSGTGDFTVFYTFTNVAGCASTDSLVVTVTDPTTADAGPDLELCLSEPAVQLETGGTWTGTNVDASGVFTPSSTGTFDLTFTIGTGTCLTTDDLTVTVFDLPTVDAGADVFICEADSTQLNAVANSPNGAISTYDWVGANVSDATLADPWVSPITTEVYTVTITDAEGCTAQDDVSVNVNGLPVVDAGPDLTLCDQPIAETLENFSPLPDANSTGEWSGIGITDPDGTFESPGVGNYTLYYTFTDIAGCTNLDSIEVEVVPPVVADAGPDQEYCLNNGVTELQGFSPQNNITWSGTGIVDAGAGSFDPLVAGEGTFTLTIEFGSGTCFTSDDVEVTVLPLPVITTTADPVFCGNDAVADLGAFAPAGGTWEGTGIVDDAAGTFDPSVGQGSYDVFYWYTDPLTGCADTSDVSVSVSPVPVADFTVEPEGCTNAPVDIENTSAGADSYEWDWGDGNTDVGFEPNFTYPDEGIFTIELVAENSFGCRDSLTLQNEIIDPPSAALTLTPDEGCAPLDVAFGNESVGQYLSFEWDLAIATSSDEIPPAQVYQQGDSIVDYEISLTATNYCGSDVAIDTVNVFPQPVAGFGTDYDQFCSPWDTQFNNTSVGLPDSYEWDFGDGNTSTLEEPVSNTYFTDDEPTDYTITLIATNECGVDTFEYTITVLPNTVTSFFNTDVTEGCEPLTVEFTDFSEGGTVISYDFGDDNVSNEPSPIHTFTEPGEYTIYQYVNNGCSFDTTLAQVTVFASPDLDFTTDVPNVCENQPVQFINLSEDVNNVEWDFGDGTTTDLTNPTHTYTSGGTFDVTISATSQTNECEATLTQPFTVFAAPEASFVVAEQVGCSPFEVDFSNTTTGGNFYQWDFGDGETGNGQTENHTFFNDTDEPALYTVTLISENLQLCADTFLYDIIVSPTPVSQFLLSDTESCTFPVTVQTTNTSLFADGYEWEFAPFGNSQLAEPEIIIGDVGSWNITLNASNSYGCENSSAQTFTVHPLPEANYTVNPGFGCVDLDVQFTNESSGAVAYEWNFGDGNTSVDLNPAHTYDTPGYYDITLVATTNQGCTDTIFVETDVAVYPVPIADFSLTPEVTDVYSPEIEFTDLSIDPQNWFWQFGDGYTSTEQDPSHVYELPGTYLINLTVTNIYGCESRDEGVVTIADEFDIYVPNAFTPDNDQVNDVFRAEIGGKELVDYYQLQVFDRWGTVVFESNDMDAVWIGDNRGGTHYAQNDVYIWQVKFRLKGAERSEIMRGHVTLIR